MIYFDHAATTPILPDVLDTYMKVAQNFFANPSSAHPLGESARQLLDQARVQFASILNFQAKDIFFTSSGTESNNWVFQSILDQQRVLHPQANRVVLSSIEHPSVSQQIQALQAKGYQVDLIEVDGQGHLVLDHLKQLIDDQVLMVSTMAVNNEVGALQDLVGIAALLKDQPHILWHVDGVQAVTSQLAVLNNPRVDLLSLSGHKFHAPRGLGILAMRERVPHKAFLLGGGQEKGMRSSTENLAAIVAGAKALRLVAEEQSETDHRLRQYRSQLVDVFAQAGWTVYGAEPLASHILAVSLAPVPGEVLLNAFAHEEIMVSTTSACSSRKHQAHHTLAAMDIPQSIAQSTIRLSMSSLTTQEEVDRVCAVIPSITHHFQKNYKE